MNVFREMAPAVNSNAGSALHSGLRQGIRAPGVMIRSN